MKSKLPQDALSKIWILSDRDKDGHLTLDEFCICMQLINSSILGIEIPKTLPTITFQTTTPQQVDENIFAQPNQTTPFNSY